MSNVSHLREPWRKGQSGNPSGSNMTPEVRKQILDARKLCAQNAEAAVRKLQELMACGQAKVELAAACEILDRAGVKAVSIDVEEVHTDERGGERVVRVQFVGTDAA